MSTSIANPLSESHTISVEAKQSSFEELAVHDLSWIVNNSSRYASLLQRIPEIFAWADAAVDFEKLQILSRSVALRRFRSCLDHIGRYDSSLAKSMQSSFEDLPFQGKLRFMTAPETFYRISRLRKEPVDSIVFLCNALNGEAALYGLAPIQKDYMSALGDFYYSESAPQTIQETVDGQSAKAVRAPLLAGSIPLDFSSPNAGLAQETSIKKEYLQYSAEEKKLVSEKLNATLERIEQINPAAAALIKRHAKVIIPLKTAEPGYGSTSQPRVPGRILLRGVENTTLAGLASAVIHESMHQVLYILEWSGPFIINHADVRAARAKSGWTGRDLALHSYIHACFIWYGLSNFWALAKSSNAFDAVEVHRELTKSLSGFRDRNPVELLAPYAGMVRYDVLHAAGTLRDRLKPVFDQLQSN